MISALSWRSFMFLLVALVPIVFASATGSLVTVSKISGWYAGLNKPWFTPPRQVFPVVWPLLYLLLTISFWRVLRSESGNPAEAMPARENKARNIAILVFFVQLIFNIAWSLAFFGAENPGAGVVMAAGLVLAVLAMILAFRRVDRFAGLLQWPYLGWVSFAFVLNFTIWRMN
jgi:translocator protein